MTIMMTMTMPMTTTVMMVMMMIMTMMTEKTMLTLMDVVDAGGARFVEEREGGTRLGQGLQEVVGAEVGDEPERLRLHPLDQGRELVLAGVPAASRSGRAAVREKNRAELRRRAPLP